MWVSCASPKLVYQGRFYRLQLCKNKYTEKKDLKIEMTCTVDLGAQKLCSTI